MPKVLFFSQVFLLLVVSLRPAPGQDPAALFGFDVPPAVDLATPPWLGQPVITPGSFATLGLPIAPPDAVRVLLVTVVFTETAGSFLRITWTAGDGSAQVLSGNFYEGIAMGNRRMLLIPAEVMKGLRGTLSLQAGGSALDIQHVELEWLDQRSELVSSTQPDLLVTPALGPTQPAATLDGQPAQDVPASWQGRVVNLPLTSIPQRVEDGVDFNLQIDDVPARARLVFNEAGLPWGKHLVVWVNGQRAGTVTPAVPDLRVTGLGDAPYAGWREGSLYLPGSLFKPGVAALQFSVEDDLSPGPADAAAPPLAMKDAVLQLFVPVPTATPADRTGALLPSIPPPSTPTAPALGDPLTNQP
jgi:hypothetical protein